MQIYAEKKSEQNNLLLRTPRNRRRAVELGQRSGREVGVAHRDDALHAAVVGYRQQRAQILLGTLALRVVLAARASRDVYPARCQARFDAGELKHRSRYSAVVVPDVRCRRVAHDDYRNRCVSHECRAVVAHRGHLFDCRAVVHDEKPRRA